MRPPEFTGGNPSTQPPRSSRRSSASMRPPEFTGGNNAPQGEISMPVFGASMRPPEFTGGNLHVPRVEQPPAQRLQ